MWDFYPKYKIVLPGGGLEGDQWAHFSCLSSVRILFTTQLCLNVGLRSILNLLVMILVSASIY